MDRVNTERTGDSRTPPTLVLTGEVLEAIIASIGSLKAESGGAIGVHGEPEVVTHYHFDESSRNSAVTYSPDYKRLNQLFKHEWNPLGVRLHGFVHSHPGTMNRPSCGDEVYAERILTAIDDLDLLWLPIVNTVPDTGEFKLVPWAAVLVQDGVEIVKGRVQVLNGDAKSSRDICGEGVLRRIQRGIAMDEIVVRSLETASSVGISTDQCLAETKPRSLDARGERQQGGQLTTTVAEAQAVRPVNVKNTFDRVQDAYALELMGKTRVIAVGTGGAAGFLEELARAGTDQFVMIDPDSVSETNLATQQTYRRDIGRPKVDCIAERIRDINPRTKTIALQKSLDDLDDEQIRQLAFAPIDGRESRRTVIFGLTDAFLAQARVNRLALHLGLSSLCAQVYREGRGAEITFTFPGVTPACHRCILSSRYSYYIEQQNENTVTSHGTPIFATTRLNAIKGFVTLALIHHGSSHSRWGGMLRRIGNRNLIQIRMDPDFAETMGMTVFNRAFENADQDRLFFDEVVWLPQEQECPDTGYAPCPDCGGTGDLRDAIGSFEDTKLTLQAAHPAVHDVRAREAIVAYERSRRTR